MSTYTITVLPGDGVGPEIIDAVLPVLVHAAERHDCHLLLHQLEAGDRCAEQHGVALPPATTDTIRASDACLKGPMGRTAGAVVVKLRQMLDLYVNLRPVRSIPGTPYLAPNTDFVIVRENTEDLYCGYEFDYPGGAVGLRVITEEACTRIAQFAFDLARRRSRARRVTAVHKENVLVKTDAVFAESCRRQAAAAPDIHYEEMLVDTAAMNIIRQPQMFDVLVTTNLFGDILSDEAAQVAGGLGLAPSANIGAEFAMFEPVHGAAFDIAGRGQANPLGTLLAARMMFDWLADRKRDPRLRAAGQTLEEGVLHTLGRGIKTPDVSGTSSTRDVAEAVLHAVSGRVEPVSSTQVA